VVIRLPCGATLSRDQELQLCLSRESPANLGTKGGLFSTFDCAVKYVVTFGIEDEADNGTGEFAERRTHGTR
jgi:hypothetical protein